MPPLTVLRSICSITLLISVSHAVYLYSGRWTQWAWTNGDSRIKYRFPYDEHEVNSFDSSATSIIFHNSGSNVDYTTEIPNTDLCWPPSSTDFNIDTVLQCDGEPETGGGGWSGIFYKNDTMDWAHLSADFWIQIVTGTLETIPYETPAPHSVFLSSNKWTEWAFTNGDEGGVRYNFRYGANQLFSFHPDATWLILKQSPDRHLYTLDATDVCWPAQNFNMDEVLLCVDVDQTGSSLDTGWAGLYYKAGVSGNPSDWSHVKAEFAVFVHVETDQPSMDPTAFPTYVPTYMPTVKPTYDPTNDPTNVPTQVPTRDPTVDPTVDPTRDPTRDPTLEPTVDPTFDPTRDPTNDPSYDPTRDPTIDPTHDPSVEPTYEPTRDPTRDPTSAPTVDPTRDPTMEPTYDPTRDPTGDPTLEPTNDPTLEPTYDPTREPTMEPTSEPTHPTQCYIGSECDRTMDCCPDHIYPRDVGITCACRGPKSEKIKLCCLKHGAIGCVDNDDCCGGKHTCFNGVCLNKKTHNNVNKKNKKKRLLLNQIH